MSGARGGERPDRVVMGAHLPEGVVRTVANVGYSAGALAEVMAAWVEQRLRIWPVRDLSAASGLNVRTVRMVVRDVVAAGHAARMPGAVLSFPGRGPYLYRMTPVGAQVWSGFRSDARLRRRPAKAESLTPHL